ncbi:MAG: LptF/LptG family permease [Phycisphaeraceae bacterium]|nr:LptF/LptG family permease [Phycisphaeraceae bacterium]
MLLLDRYILRQFLVNFVILMGILLSLFVVVDMLATIDEFIQAGEMRADEFGGRTRAFILIAADFYLPMCLLLGVVFVGLATYAAMGFTLHHLIRTRELTAVLTSGISMYRIAAPILVAGGLINLGALPIQEMVIPTLADKLVRHKSELKHGGERTSEIWYAPDGMGNLISAAVFDAGRGMLEDVSVLVRARDGTARARITADQAFWDNERGHWRLIGGYRVLIQGTDLDAPVADVGLAQFMDPIPLDHFESDLSPSVLLARQQALYPRVLSVAELNRLSRKRAADIDAFTRIAHSRFSFVLAGILMLVIGAPFYLLREPSNLLWEGAKAAVVGVGVWMTSLLVLQVGIAGLNPYINAWLPVVLGLPLAAFMFTRVRT